MTGETTVAPAVEMIFATGRRKSAVARVRIRRGEGRFLVNRRMLQSYFTTERDRQGAVRPLKVTGTEGQLDIFVRAIGGGPTGQSGAIAMGLARALKTYDPSFESKLRAEGLLTRDARMKERKKYGRRGARRSFQFSKR